MKPSTYTAIGNAIETFARPLALLLVVAIWFFAGLKGLIVAALVMAFYEIHNYIMFGGFNDHQPQSGSIEPRQQHQQPLNDDE